MFVLLECMHAPLWFCSIQLLHDNEVFVHEYHTMIVVPVSLTLATALDQHTLIIVNPTILNIVWCIILCIQLHVVCVRGQYVHAGVYQNIHVHNSSTCTLGAVHS